MSKDQILANLRKAREIIAAAPDEHFNLNHFKSPCGTHFCAAGHLANDPYFKALGWEWYVIEKRVYRIHVESHDITSLSGHADLQHGPDAFYRLFDSRGEGTWDEEIELNHDQMLTDKELALARIDRQIQEVESEA